MSHKRTMGFLLLMFVLLLVAACVPFRALGPAQNHEARIPEILLPGPYEYPDEAQSRQITTASDHLRDIFVGLTPEPMLNTSNSDILRGPYEYGP